MFGFFQRMLLLKYQMYFHLKTFLYLIFSYAFFMDLKGNFNLISSIKNPPFLYFRRGYVVIELEIFEKIPRFSMCYQVTKWFLGYFRIWRKNSVLVTYHGKLSYLASVESFLFRPSKQFSISFQSLNVQMQIYFPSMQQWVICDFSINIWELWRTYLSGFDLFWTFKPLNGYQWLW